MREPQLELGKQIKHSHRRALGRFNYKVREKRKKINKSYSKCFFLGKL
jgi:hypothetical protein